LDQRGAGAPDKAYADWSFSVGLKGEPPCAFGLFALVETPNRRAGVG
jgi:hypothetical protein